MIKFSLFTPKAQKHRMDYEKLNNLVHIDTEGIYEPLQKKLFDAQDVMANYIDNKGLSVDIFDARKSYKNTVNPLIESDSVMLKMTDKLTGVEKSREVIIDSNEPFLRSVYKTLENLTNSFNI